MIIVKTIKELKQTMSGDTLKFTDRGVPYIVHDKTDIILQK